ncbi:bifunctional 2-polyprenyl-6-hydroxyphenol methylase/3-demethylubiquinol 3-O-methyltransferase UbiG [Chelatococcus reniformis]|nr:bifunctional 2-polyprenyl-6-hydroxyphenol methylase/3-demethylubiquinol 3-O-methyltransferase UbiG [Chelatococcus reniformis]
MQHSEPSRDRRADPAEVARFDRLARDWWDPQGPMKPLHRMNPMRLAFVRDEACARFGRDPRAEAPLDGLTVLDVGCGAGMLAEPLARLGATVKGIDPAPANIAVARGHAAAGGLAIAYTDEAVEDVGERFDIVTAMEVVEHVPSVPRFVQGCCDAVKPGGLLVMATLNRTMKSFALAIVGAEYVLRWLPRGTHDWNRFVTPAELTRAIDQAGLAVDARTGVAFDPLADRWRLSADMAVNYMLTAVRGGSRSVRSA